MSKRKILILAFVLAVAFGACASEVPALLSVSDASVDADVSEPRRDSADEKTLIQCDHPPVFSNCTGGWCRIPAGCFWSGSPEEEWGRAVSREPLAPITLTRSFVIQRFETTIEEWKAVGFDDPTGKFPNVDLAACTASNCPVTGLAWVEALAYANARSDQDGLPHCYELRDCTGKPGDGMECRDFNVIDSTSYNCRGYRLPMGAEREYAMRAGTRTAFHSGEIHAYPELSTCYPDGNLEKIAWFCNNYGGTTHPVGLKMPNGWGIHDMSGNVAEFVIDHNRTSGYGEGPAVDPGDPIDHFPTRGLRGGAANGWSTILRSASWLGDAGMNERADGTGVRLVRTLSPSELDGGGAPRDGAE